MRRVGPYSVLESRGIYTNPWLSVREDQLLRPDGSRGVFGVVEMKAGATVLAIDDDNQVLLARELNMPWSVKPWN